MSLPKTPPCTYSPSIVGSSSSSSSLLSNLPYTSYHYTMPSKNQDTTVPSISLESHQSLHKTPIDCSILQEGYQAHAVIPDVTSPLHMYKRYGDYFDRDKHTTFSDIKEDSERADTFSTTASGVPSSISGSGPGHSCSTLTGNDPIGVNTQHPISSNDINIWGISQTMPSNIRFQHSIDHDTVLNDHLTTQYINRTSTKPVSFHHLKNKSRILELGSTNTLPVHTHRHLPSNNFFFDSQILINDKKEDDIDDDHNEDMIEDKEDIYTQSNRPSIDLSSSHHHLGHTTTELLSRDVSSGYLFQESLLSNSLTTLPESSPHMASSSSSPTEYLGILNSATLSEHGSAPPHISSVSPLIHNAETDDTFPVVGSTKTLLSLEDTLTVKNTPYLTGVPPLFLSHWNIPIGHTPTTTEIQELQQVLQRTLAFNHSGKSNQDSFDSSSKEAGAAAAIALNSFHSNTQQNSTSFLLKFNNQSHHDDVTTSTTRHQESQQSLFDAIDLSAPNSPLIPTTRRAPTASSTSQVAAAALLRQEPRDIAQTLRHAKELLEASLMALDTSYFRATNFETDIGGTTHDTTTTTTTIGQTGLINSLASAVDASAATVNVLAPGYLDMIAEERCHSSKRPMMLAHPDEFKNPSSFLKIYGDPQCNARQNSARVHPRKGKDGNWECPRCKNVNYPRRFRCNNLKCKALRDPDGDKLVSDYARQVFHLYLTKFKASTTRINGSGGSLINESLNCPVASSNYCLLDPDDSPTIVFSNGRSGLPSPPAAASASPNRCGTGGFARTPIKNNFQHNLNFTLAAAAATLTQPMKPMKLTGSGHTDNSLILSQTPQYFDAVDTSDGFVNGSHLYENSQLYCQKNHYLQTNTTQHLNSFSQTPSNTFFNFGNGSHLKQPPPPPRDYDQFYYNEATKHHSQQLPTIEGNNHMSSSVTPPIDHFFF